MKFAAAMISMLSAPLSRGTGRAMIRLGLLFFLAVVVFATGFQVVMTLVEGRDFTWAQAVYWTLVTMTTLGYGDIVFETDPGRLYSVVVLLTGALMLLILLPFTFIQLVYLPWRAAMREARIPRELPEDTAGHLVLTGRSPMERLLMRRADTVGVPWVLIVEDPEEGAALSDDGYRVLVGDHDDPATYRAARADAAAMVFAAAGDQANTNIAFTVREVTDRPVLVATANSKDSIDILGLAGVDHILHSGDLLGRAFVERILAPTAQSSVISRFDNLVIAEASAAGTELVGKTLGELRLRDDFGVSVVGVWERGSLLEAHPAARIDESSILLLAGTEEQLAAYNAAFAGTRGPAVWRRSSEAGGDNGEEFVVILGGGRVGRAIGRSLEVATVDHCLVEQRPERVQRFPDAVIGNAADREVLREAGIERATAVVVTTHDDDMNIYLTLYCRRLRPEAEILGRVALERNVTTMHRAGADFVLSYASVTAIEAWNAMQPHRTLLLAEGLVAFRVPVPPGLRGRGLSEAGVSDTGCVLVGVVEDGHCFTGVDGDTRLPDDADLVLVGSPEAEARFYARFIRDGSASRLSLRLRRLVRAEDRR